MLLDLEDANLRANIRYLSGDRLRLVLDYPAEPRYRNRVMKTLAELLAPAPEPLRRHLRRTEAAGR